MPPVVAVQATRQSSCDHQYNYQSHTYSNLSQAPRSIRSHADRNHDDPGQALETSPVSTPPRSFALCFKPPSPPPGRLHESELLIPVVDAAIVLRVARNDANLAAQAKARRYVNCFERLNATHMSTVYSGAVVAPSYDDRVAESIFHLRETPSISVPDYLSRLVRYSYCSKSVFVGAIILLDRLAAKDPFLAPTSSSIHRLLITAVLLTTKSFDDELFDNAHFAKVGGLTLADLNALELAMLKELDFKLHISDEEFASFEHEIVNMVLQTVQPAYRSLRYSLKKAGFVTRPASLPGSPLSSNECDSGCQSDVISSTTLVKSDDVDLACPTARRALSFGPRSEPSLYFSRSSFPRKPL